MSPGTTAGQHTAQSVTFPALGTTAYLAVADPDGLEPAREALERLVEEIDLACSRFRDDSELSRLNAAAGRTVPVSPLLLEAVTAGIRAAQITDGDVDPTVGQALIALGYDRDFAQLDPAAQGPPIGAVRVTAVPGWRSVHLDLEHSTVRLARGVSLDLGATAKALAADLAAADAHAEADCSVLIGLGGDFAAAGPPPEGGWRIRVTDDHRAGADAPGQWITITGGGLATSSTTARRWQRGRHVAHHLIDPATGRSAEVVWRTASVTAGSCLDANIASTAAVIRGHRAPEWLQSVGLPARLVAADGTVRHLAGWPAAGDDLPDVDVDGPVSA